MVPPSFKGRGVGEYQVILLLFVIVVFMGIVVIIHRDACFVQGEGALFLPSSSISSLLLMSFSWALLSSFIIQGAGAMHVNTGIISTIVFNLIRIIVTVLSSIHAHYCHRSRVKGGGQTRTYQDPCDSWPQGDAYY